jgi:hypothetical protein
MEFLQAYRFVFLFTIYYVTEIIWLWDLYKKCVKMLSQNKSVIATRLTIHNSENSALLITNNSQPTTNKMRRANKRRRFGFRHQISGDMLDEGREGCR